MTTNEPANGFLYFWEEFKSQVSLDDVRKIGLGYAFDSAPICCRVQRGPSHSAGVVFARAGAHLGNVGYYPDSQSWELTDLPGVWVGWLTDNKPAPSDLERPTMLSGVTVELNDGNWWHCPIARSITEGDEQNDFLIYPHVPQVIKRVNGEWVHGEIINGYRQLWDVANRVFDDYVNALADPKGEHVQNITWDDCICALQTNYFVGPAEASALEIFTTTGSEMWEILAALIDRDSYLEWIKKKLPEVEQEESTCSGAKD